MKADLILHPVRMQILLALKGRQLTAKQLGAELSDVATATLYHHLGLLSKAGLVRVAEERPVRGTVEKVYVLSEEAPVLSQQEMEGISREEQLRYFTIFVSGLISDYDRYLEQNQGRIGNDMGYRQAPFYLTDEEFVQFTNDLRQALLPWYEKKPGPGRRRRMLTTILFSDPQSETQDTSAETNTDENSDY